MELEHAVRSRRTVKVFTGEPVDRATLTELFELAAWAPNHHLTNPWRFRVIGAQTLARLKPISEAAKIGSARKLERAPTLVSVSVQQSSADPLQREEDLLASAVAAYLVLLGAHGRGLAGYWRSAGVTATPEGRQVIGLEPDEHPIGLLYLGHHPQGRPLPQRGFAAPHVRYLD